MYRKILLAYDGCDHSAAAVQQAAGLARLCSAELHLLGIVVTTGAMALAEGIGSLDVWGMERKSLQEAMDVTMRSLEAQGVHLMLCVREGDPEVEIVAHACHIGADLIVLGHSHRGLVGRLFQGSVGAQLLKDIPCSLLIAASAT